MSDSPELRKAAEAIRKSRKLAAFTGAGISVESGIPPFRGSNGIWNRYDSSLLDIDCFLRSPARSWEAIKAMFTGFLATADRAPVAPNPAHRVLAKWEAEGRLAGVITQNIDGLHTTAGSRNVIEYHGHCRTMTCLDCGKTIPLTAESTAADVPRCACGGLLKPDFIFFGEGIPPKAARDAEELAATCDCMVLVGTSGAVYPAAALPPAAKRRGAAIVEINPEPTAYTERGVTDVFIAGKAGETFLALDRLLGAAGNGKDGE